jgi:hypothetical protein
LDETQNEQVISSLMQTIGALQTIINTDLSDKDTTVENTVDKIEKTALLTANDIDLLSLKTKYTVTAPLDSDQLSTQAEKETADREAATQIEQLNVGLVMNVVAGSRFATGIDIPSLRYTTIAMNNPNATRGRKEYLQLSSPVLASQALGRPIRSTYGTAYVLLELTDKVSQDEYLTASSMTSKDSGEKVKNIYEVRKNKQQAAIEKHIAIEKQYENAGEVEWNLSKQREYELLAKHNEERASTAWYRNEHVAKGKKEEMALTKQRSDDLAAKKDSELSSIKEMKIVSSVTTMWKNKTDSNHTEMTMQEHELSPLKK